MKRGVAIFVGTNLKKMGINLTSLSPATNKTVVFREEIVVLLKCAQSDCCVKSKYPSYFPARVVFRHAWMDVKYLGRKLCFLRS
jgi:hypothetical protein